MTQKELLAKVNAAKIGDGGWFALDATPPDAVPYNFRAAAEVFQPWNGYVMTSTAVKKLLRTAQDAVNDRLKTVNKQRREIFGSDKAELEAPSITVEEVRTAKKGTLRISIPDATFAVIRSCKVLPLTKEEIAKLEAEKTLTDNTRETSKNQ